MTLASRWCSPCIAVLAAMLLTVESHAAAAAMLEARIASGADDAEESAAGVVALHSSDLELVRDADNQLVGMLWPALAIPANATITRAWIQFTAKSADLEPTGLAFFAEDVDDAAPFATDSLDISRRALTTVDVDWAPVPWAAGESGANQQTPDLAPLIEAIVRRPGWVSGHALAIIVKGSGRRTAWAWDGNAPAAPLLHVEYVGDSTQPPPPPPPPPPSDPIAVYVGYYDTHHPDRPQTKPSPWKGSPDVTFVGRADPDGGWDSACVMIENLTDLAFDDVRVTVDIGIEHFALWSAQELEPLGKLIFAQTAFENFDGSDTNEAGCFGCDPSACISEVSSTVPMITVKLGAATGRFFDRDQVLNTRGVDGAGCPYTGGRNDESHAWVQLKSGSSGLTGVGPQDSTALPSPRVVDLMTPVPNPAHGSTMLRFRMPASRPVHLGLYDLAGRLVRTCVDGWFETGVYLKGMDLSGVRPGVYFAILRAPGGSARTRLTVMR